MTPMVRAILRRCPLTSLFDDHHFFDLTELYEVVKDSAEDVRKWVREDEAALEDFPLRLPFPKIVIEFVARGQRRAWHLHEQADGAVRLFELQVNDAQAVAHPVLDIYPDHAASIDSNLLGILDFHGANKSDVYALYWSFALAFVLIINTPQSFVQKWRPAKLFGRTNKAFAGGRFPLLGYTEIKLEVNPETLRECGSTERHITGRKAFHWVRGHFRRYKSGLVIWIDPHTKGDPSLGFRQQRYRVEMRADGRSKAERRDEERAAHADGARDRTEVLWFNKAAEARLHAPMLKLESA